ncbi:rab11 family-interacting protein 1 isoform X2 [Denticeps clupeoides]|uniref:RAB11 family interacting protein 5b (class I) n=1 Tax=Denticeps clupeoides TaxID=299321 RepID=A0AAY4DGC5_9TELE|nr:rab11 family-interacting protein 1-like isoform X2 [Denticeps clupeoides]
MPLLSLDDEERRWLPTHVSVTLLAARGLRSRGRQGSRFVYAALQLAGEKRSTALVERSRADVPDWGEELCFELPPGRLESGPGGCSLLLTVMHRVLIGRDVFLGQAAIPLDKVFQDGACPRNEWLKLHSKSGRKEKDCGELQVTVQFTRNNLTASMYDLSVKEKPRSAFGKLKDRVTGKKRDAESSSAIVPGRYAALAAQPAGEDEQGDEERRGKVKDLLLKGKLRRSSDTRSCSSLASESSVASSLGDPACPVVEPPLSATPVYSSRVLADGFHREVDGGQKAFSPPRVMTHKRARSDEADRVATSGPRPCPAVDQLKGQGLVSSKSSLCINGSHVYTCEPGAAPARRSLLEKCSPLSRSLQNLARRAEDPRSLEKNRKESGEAEPAEAEPADKARRPRKSLFSGGRSDSLPARTDQAAPPHEGRVRGWFGAADPHNKPSLEVPPKVDTALPIRPRTFSQPLPFPSPACSHGDSHHTNPFAPPPPTSIPISPSNPFLTRLQYNPFFQELLAEEALRSPPACGSPSPAHRGGVPKNALPARRERPRSVARQRSLPAMMTGATGAGGSAFPRSPADSSLPECTGEWDDSFEAFAASRLQSPSRQDVPPVPPRRPANMDSWLGRPQADQRLDRPTAQRHSGGRVPGAAPSAVSEYHFHSGADLRTPGIPSNAEIHIQPERASKPASVPKASAEDAKSGPKSSLDSPEFAFVDSDSSPSDATVIEIYDRNANKTTSPTFPTFAAPGNSPGTATECGAQATDHVVTTRGPGVSGRRKSDLESKHAAPEITGTQCPAEDKTVSQAELKEDALCDNERSVPRQEVLQPQSQLKDGDVHLKEMSFEDLHARVAPDSRNPSKAVPEAGLSLHDSACPPSPSPVAHTNAKPAPDPATSAQNGRLPAGGTLAVAPYAATPSTVQTLGDARHVVPPEETRPASQSSPHPVKPLTPPPPPPGEKRSEGRSVLEKLKSTIHPGRSAPPPAAERQASLSEARAQYQNLTNMELIALLLQQEADGERLRADGELQRALLEKREAELRKMKVQVRDLEDYIDKLLVRIMEQTPTLLQVRSRYK